MTSSKELILQLKAVREEKKYSLDQIRARMDSDKKLAKSTISRVFAKGSEDEAGTFSYEYTLIPLANALLDIDVYEETDSMDVKAMKSLLKSKYQRIQELEHELDKEIISRNEEMEKQRVQFNRSIEFLKGQIVLKDNRIDFLLESLKDKEEINKRLLDQVMFKKE